MDDVTQQNAALVEEAAAAAEALEEQARQMVAVVARFQLEEGVKAQVAATPPARQVTRAAQPLRKGTAPKAQKAQQAVAPRAAVNGGTGHSAPAAAAELDDDWKEF
jgi:methyl-accepting chemotaxis protein